LRWHRVAHDHRPPGSHDARLLTPDAFTVLAQNGGVVDVDAGDDGAIGIHDVDRIEPPAQTHFQNGHIQMGVGHEVHDGQGAELEIGQTHIAAHRLHGGKGFGQRIGRGRFAMQTAALFKMH